MLKHETHSKSCADAATSASCVIYPLRGCGQRSAVGSLHFTGLKHAWGVRSLTYGALHRADAGLAARGFGLGYEIVRVLCDGELTDNMFRGSWVSCPVW